MPHQAQVVAAAQDGHRTFLLADEPGLGKTAQALLAAQAAGAYPLLVRRPQRRQDQLGPRGRAVDAAPPGHRHPRRRRRPSTASPTSWSSTTRCSTGTSAGSGDLGFRGMVVDEAHFIKNKTSQRSQHVLQLSERIRARTARPLLMALTGTPLINDIEDFRAIWQFLGWIDDKKPQRALMEALEETGLTPARPRLLPRGPLAASSTWASCAAARSTSPPTSRPAASPTCRSSSTTPSAAPSARPSASSPAAWSAATTPRSRPAPAVGAPSRASTTTWSAGSPAWEREDTQPRTRPARTSSR